MFGNFLECVLVLDLVLGESVIGLSTDKSSNSFSEFFSSHAGILFFNVLSLDNSSFEGDSGGSFNVITSAHSNGDSRLLSQSFDGCWYVSSKWILDTKDS